MKKLKCQHYKCNLLTNKEKPYNVLRSKTCKTVETEGCKGLLNACKDIIE